MRRFFTDNRESNPRSLCLEGGEAAHAAKVIRLQPGEETIAINGCGGYYRCRVLNVSKSRVELDVIENLSRPPLPWRITLCQAIPRGGLMEDIVEKATELGVRRIIPLLTSRTEVKISSSREGEAKREKWLVRAREACKQCGNAWMPEILPPLRFTQWLTQRRTFYSELKSNLDLAFTASLEPETRSIHEWFDDYSKRMERQASSAELWVGPEGDFTPEEYLLLRNEGVLPVTLGPLVLRCATAAVSIIAITLAECRQRN